AGCRVRRRELGVGVGGDEALLRLRQVADRVLVVQVLPRQPVGAGDLAAPAIIWRRGEPRLVCLHVVHEQEDRACGLLLVEPGEGGGIGIARAPGRGEAGRRVYLPHGAETDGSAAGRRRRGGRGAA